ncbi:nematode fatty acid retinoid binding protein (Gp-FAR-1) domain-containing protein [Ditylenchus destructor]|nr:nematode fatty acid retinoid binding protein (Gp-FAR-1) domain-containing protein [Ditylenchus destructor]
MASIYGVRILPCLVVSLQVLIFLGINCEAKPLQAHDLDLTQLDVIVPVEAKQFYESLTSTDKQVLQKVLSKADNYTSVKEVLLDLRNGSTTLYDKTVGIVTQMRSTIASLSKPARGFVDQTVNQINNALGGGFSPTKIKNEARAIVERFKALDNETKEELKAAFPMVAKVVYNNIFQTLAAGLLGVGWSAE